MQEHLFNPGQGLVRVLFVSTSGHVRYSGTTTQSITEAGKNQTRSKQEDLSQSDGAKRDEEVCFCKTAQWQFDKPLMAADAKPCRTEKFIVQKLNYMHNNPCPRKWRLCVKPWQYAQSSARFYDGGKQG